ncbi:MAG TPA: hypothetical protein VFW63_00605 [Acidimicrobiales bacterium]|nr:hypothetical protein [Acidimicrobiales bacterium]
MASTSGNRRLVLVAVLGAFVAGCWTGMESDQGGSDPWCVVTVASAAQRPGFVPGQLVEPAGADCLGGEPRVCGTFDRSGGDRRFVSDSCEGD